MRNRETIDAKLHLLAWCLLGHASIATTERYCAVDDAEIRAAMVAAVGD